MNSAIARAFLIITISLSCIAVSARPWRLADAVKHPVPFLAGMATGVGVHELGHITLASAEGYSVEVHHLAIMYAGKAMTPRDHAEIASAGYQAQWVLSEAVLRNHEDHHPTQPMPDFQAGMVMGHIAISAAYLTVLRNNPDGDLRGIHDATGLSTWSMALMLAVPAALDYWRLTGRNVPRWVPALSIGCKGAAMGAIWTY